MADDRGAAAPASLPPVTALCMASMGTVIAGGIYLAAHLPRVPPLGPVAGFTIAGGALLIVALGALARVRGFAWERFFLVARYTMLAYVVIAGLLAYVFINDGTRGNALVVLLLTLVIFAIDVPVILGFTVARYHRPTTA
jgi:hypothetical protein